MPIDIQHAQTADELEAIFRFRYGIYVEEMGKPMPGADHAARLLHDALDARSTQLFARKDGELAGVMRITLGRAGIPVTFHHWYELKRFQRFSLDQISFTGRLMVAQKFRRTAVALQLACEAYRLGRPNGVCLNFIHTTPPLVPFFERLGHRRYASEFLDPDLGPRTPLVLALNDVEHLKSCRSPFIELAPATSWPVEVANWFRSAVMPNSDVSPR